VHGVIIVLGYSGLMPKNSCATSFKPCTMLKSIDPLLTPDLLRILCEMGHGNTVVIADANFTAMQLASANRPAPCPVIRMPGIGLARVAQAVLSVLPLGTLAEQPVQCMQVGGTAQGYLSAVQREVMQLVNAQYPKMQVQGLERFAFYEATKNAYAIIQTGELQPYANFILAKGVLAEPLRE
jgi:L-fucose mutarotase